MKIKVGISKTINIGNFENIKPSIEVEDALMENEDYEDAHERISKICHELFNEELTNVLNIEKGEEKKKWISKYQETMEK